MRFETCLRAVLDSMALIGYPVFVLLNGMLTYSLEMRETSKNIYASL